MLQRAWLSGVGFGRGHAYMSNPSLLIIDSGSGLRAMLNSLFKDRFRVEIVTDGEGALAKLAEEPFEVMLLAAGRLAEADVESVRQLLAAYPDIRFMVVAEETEGEGGQRLLIGGGPGFGHRKKHQFLFPEHQHTAARLSSPVSPCAP